MHDLYLGAYWKARKEDMESCAARLGRFLIGLSACDPLLERWYKLGKSRRTAKQVEIDFRNRNSLLELLERGRHRKDMGKAVMEDLGFLICLWNGGEPGREVGLTITCGLYSTVPGLGGNGIGIDLPQELGDLRQTEHMAKVLLAVATSWQPDWAGVISRKSRETRSFAPEKPFLDWMLYVNRPQPLNAQVPPPASVRAVDSMGWLIVVQNEPVDPDNPAHLHQVAQVESALALTE